ALLPSDANRAGDVMEQLLQASPQELPALSKALRPYANTVNPRLWGVLDTDAAATHERFNAGLPLAGLDPPYSTEKPAPWQGHATFLVDQFLKAARANPSSYATLSEAMRPLRIVLLDALGAVFRDRRRPDYDRLLTTTLLADYAADQPGVLVGLLKDADAEQYRALLPTLRPYADQTVTAMTAELARVTRPSAPDRVKETRALRQ